MKVWRLSRARHASSIDAMLSGQGARRFGGRWTPPGMAAVYCAETSSLAALEVLVHLADPGDFMAYAIVDLVVPDDLLATPTGASSNPQSVGGTVLLGWLGMIVPSAVNALEHTIVLNPEHEDFSRVTAGNIVPFVLDGRLRRDRAR